MGSLIDFYGGMASTPPKVYGTSREDAELRQQQAGASGYWTSGQSNDARFLPANGGSTANTASSLYGPSYGGSGKVNTVPIQSVGGIQPGSTKNNYWGQDISYFPVSGYRPTDDLLTGVGGYGSADARLGAPVPPPAGAPVFTPMLPRARPPYAPNMMDIAGMKLQAAKLAAAAKAAKPPPRSVSEMYVPPRAPPPQRLTRVQQLEAQGMSPSQAYNEANRQSKERAIANSSDPVGNSARASLASNWGFD